MKKKVIIGSDHAGFEAKKEIIGILKKMEVDYEDMGTYSKKSVDYPVIAKKVCEKVLSEDGFGILICGSGEGMHIAANRIKGIRADFVYDEYSAIMSRHDNDANVMTLRSREFDHGLYERLVRLFLETEFSGAMRHKRRIDLLDK